MRKRLIASHGEALVIFQVSFLKSGYIDVFFVEFLCKGDFLLISPFCIPLQNVDVLGVAVSFWSVALTLAPRLLA